jgi:signal transduction histidine kinase
MRFSIKQGYILLLVCCAILFALLAFHELVREPHAYAAGGADAEGPKWVALAELAIYCCVPIILLASWLLIRRTLRPLHEIARRIDAWDPERGLRPLEKTDSPETLEVALSLSRASERLRRAFQEIREFSLRASHEIKTPLTILRAQAETESRLAESRGDAQGTARMEVQIEEIDRLARLVDSLGLLSKADAGMLALNIIPARLDELVMEFLDDIRVLAEPTGLVVGSRIDQPVFAFFDSRRMRQVFLSLAENAVKYNIPGGVIEMGAGKIKNQAILWIENTGTPIEALEAAKVFEPFFRGAQTSREVEGAGLGLSIARSVIEAQGGCITFSSIPPNRVRVTIQLPPVPADVVLKTTDRIPELLHTEHGLGSGI